MHGTVRSHVKLFISNAHLSFSSTDALKRAYLCPIRIRGKDRTLQGMAGQAQEGSQAIMHWAAQSLRLESNMHGSFTWQTVPFHCGFTAVH